MYWTGILFTVTVKVTRISGRNGKGLHSLTHEATRQSWSLGNKPPLTVLCTRFINVLFSSKIK